MPYLINPLVPKNPDGPLRVIMMGRVSTIHQDLENIEASYRFVEGHLNQLYQGPMEIKHLGERASGMRTDRATILEAQELIATGTWDLVIAEDLSRIFRNPGHQIQFVQDAYDHDTRVICIGDNLDTGDEIWEASLGSAAFRHGMHIPDTRRRVKRTATHAFRLGGMVQKVLFGYRKLTKEEAATGQFGPPGLRLAKNPDCTPIIKEMRERVLRGQTYADIATWLEEEGVKPGPYVTSGRWTGRTVIELLRSPLLSGMRIFRKTISQTVFKTGKKRQQRNPSDPERGSYPVLAHLTVEEHESLLSQMNERKKNGTGAKQGREHPLFQRPRSHSLWPGQHLRCGICGDLLYWGGRKHLKCKNAFVRGHRRCWNHVQVPAELMRRKIIDWLCQFLTDRRQLREELIDVAWTEYQRTLRRSENSASDLEQQMRVAEKRADNLGKAIAEGGELSTLVQQLAGVEQQLKDLRAQRSIVESQRSSQMILSRDDIAGQLPTVLFNLAGRSFAFADVMRRLLPCIVIQPVQFLDRATVRPRAKIKFNLSTEEAIALASGKALPTADFDMVIDLFEPPQHIRYLQDCLDAKATLPKASLRKIAAAVGISYMTVKRALRYARLMEQEGMTEPYRELQEPPKSIPRWKRRRPSPPSAA